MGTPSPAEPAARRPRRWRYVLVAAVLLVAIGALLAGPGRGLRADIARQRDLLELQLATTREQLELTTRQLEVTTEQLQVARTQLEVAQRQERIASEQLEIAREQLARTEESLDEQRRLRAIAEATLRQAQELNRKTPDLNPAQ